MNNLLSRKPTNTLWILILVHPCGPRYFLKHWIQVTLPTNKLCRIFDNKKIRMTFFCTVALLLCKFHKLNFKFSLLQICTGTKPVTEEWTQKAFSSYISLLVQDCLCLLWEWSPWLPLLICLSPPEKCTQRWRTSQRHLRWGSRAPGQGYRRCPRPTRRGTAQQIAAIMEGWPGWKHYIRRGVKGGWSNKTNYIHGDTTAETIQKREVHISETETERLGTGGSCSRHWPWNGGCD